MDKSKIGGVIICVVSVVLVLVFLWGIAIQSYWAVAIPVLVAFVAVMALAFWIGWTMVVTETEIPAPTTEEERTTGTTQP